MLAISASAFNEAGSLVKDWLKNPLNAAFFYWYFLPAVGFVALQIFVIGPALGKPAANVFDVNVGAAKSTPDLILQLLSARFFALILLPLLISVVLSSLSARVLRLYQGTLPITRPLFQPWLTRNQNRSRSFYGALPLLRREYLFLASRGIRLVTENGEARQEVVPESERPTAVERLQQEIQALHEKFEADAAAPVLPVDPERVGATDLANALALAEEYPFERYAIDAAVFWPRLSAEVEPEKLESMTTSFGAMCGLLNLSLLSYLFAGEALVVVVMVKAGWTTQAADLAKWVLTAAAVSVLIGLATYRAAVGSARSVGNAFRAAFDSYRDRVLSRFNLKMPSDIDQERVVWLKLGAFIRRGESFYYPSEYRRN